VTARLIFADEHLRRLAMAGRIRTATSAAVILSLLVNVPLVGRASADIIRTEQLIDAHRSATDRERVERFMAREDVRTELLKYGVGSEEAMARIAALSDQEIEEIATRIDQLPAGQDGVGAVLGVAFAVFVILLITDLLCLTTVFNFTRCAR